MKMRENAYRHLKTHMSQKLQMQKLGDKDDDPTMFNYFFEVPSDVTRNMVRLLYYLLYQFINVIHTQTKHLIRIIIYVFF